MPFESIPDDFDAPGSASPALMRAAAAGSVVAVVLMALPLTGSGRPWPELPGFVWVHAATYVLACTIMTALLAYQAVVAASRSLSVLAGATLYSALSYLIFFLCFPGTVREGVWLGGSQSAVWTYQFGHVGFILGLLAAALLGLAAPRLRPPRANWTGWSLGAALAASLLVAYLVLARASLLPGLLDRTLTDPTLPLFHRVRGLVDGLAILTVLVCLVAARTRSRARIWLLLAAAITAAESVKATQGDDRFTAGWYLSRLFGMAGFLLLLIVLILEVLRQSRELVQRRAELLRLAQVVEQSPVGQYVVDNDMRVLDVNAAFTHLTGFSRGELLGRPLPIVPDPGAKKLALSLLERLRTRATESVSMRVQVPRKGRSAMWADWSAHVLLDGSGAVVGTAGSFTDASGAMAIDLDVQVPVGVAITSRDCRLTQVNAALGSLAGRPMQELLDTSMLDLVVADDCERVTELCERLRAGAATSETIECRIGRPDGAQGWVLLYAAALCATDGAFDGATLQLVDIEERKSAEAAAEAAEREMAYRARYDILTRLLNHQSLVEHVDELLQQVESSGHVAVVLLDIDGFQAVSNALTRQEGDAVLCELAQLIVDHVGTREQVARLAADEFAFAVQAGDGVEVAQSVRRLMQAVTDHEFGLEGKHVYLTVSVGVTLGKRGMLGADLLQEADMAMRQSQRSGRGNWQMFTHEYRAEVQSRVQLTSEMHDALGRDEFRPWYMPVVRLQDRQVAGYEALIRWHRATGVRAPNEFLRVAEETGFIVDVGERVFQRAVQALLDLPPSVTMAVNASPTQLLRGDVFFNVRNLLAESGVAPERLIVEITEQSLFDSSKASDANLFRLAELGVGIHVDDFGTGYSSITHIRDFPITGLKLDTSFTAGLDRGQTQSIEIAGILGELTHRLGIDGVAEGVETEQQAARLRELGWECGQGWLFGKPQPEPQPANAA